MRSIITPFFSSLEFKLHHRAIEIANTNRLSSQDVLATGGQNADIGLDRAFNRPHFGKTSADGLSGTTAGKVTALLASSWQSVKQWINPRLAGKQEVIREQRISSDCMIRNSGLAAIAAKHPCKRWIVIARLNIMAVVSVRSRKARRED